MCGPGIKLQGTGDNRQKSQADGTICTLGHNPDIGLTVKKKLQYRTIRVLIQIQFTSNREPSSNPAVDKS